MEVGAHAIIFSFLVVWIDSDDSPIPSVAVVHILFPDFCPE
jgi:hypothetical protein